MILVWDGYVDFAESWTVPLHRASARLASVIYLQPDPDHAGIRGWRSLAGGRSEVAPDGGPGLDVVRLPALLPGSRFRAISHLNRWVALRLLLSRLRRRTDAPVVLFLQRPYLLPTLRGLPAHLRIYEVTDDYVASARPTTRAQRVRRAHRRFVRQADQVWATTEQLLEPLQRQRPDARASHMGVDYDAFAAGVATGCPESLRRIPVPRIGLVGRLNDRIDWALVERLCDADPDWNVVFVGPIYLAGAATREALERLERRSNFHLLPAVPRSEMPAYVAGLDVCLIPYRVIPGTSSIQPIKLYEYLATGRPVVSTPLPAMADFDDVVDFAEPDAFAATVHDALAGVGGDLATLRRQDRAHQHDWNAIAEQRLEALREMLAAVSG